MKNVNICKGCKNYSNGTGLEVLNCKVFNNLDRKYMKGYEECPFLSKDISVEPADEDENRLYGGILGLFVGDALGVPYEGYSRWALRTKDLTFYKGFGTHDVPAGTWSDDSQLVLATMDAFNRGYSVERLADNFVDWYRNGKFTPAGKGVFDIGNRTLKSIMNLEMEISRGRNDTLNQRLVTCNKYSDSDNGNGALMRILPYAFISGDLYNKVEESASLTHGHLISKVACIIYVTLAKLLSDGNDKYKALELTHRLLSEQGYLEGTGNVFDRLWKIDSLKENDIKSTGYVVDTLEAAVWCLMTESNFSDTVQRAVRLGNDTDTVGAVAGGLAGIYYGYKEIPERYIVGLVDIENILPIIKEFS